MQTGCVKSTFQRKKVKVHCKMHGDVYRGISKTHKFSAVGLYRK